MDHRGVGLGLRRGGLRAPEGGAGAEPDAQPGDPDEGYTYKSACCTVNCTSRCHLRARVKDDRICGIVPGQMPGRDDYANACLARHGAGAAHARRGRARHVPHEAHGERGAGEFERISWDQAIDEIAARMEETKAKHGAQACGFYSFTGNLAKLSWEAPRASPAPTAPPRSTSRASWATTARPWA